MSDNDQYVKVTLEASLKEQATKIIKERTGLTIGQWVRMQIQKEVYDHTKE